MLHISVNELLQVTGAQLIAGSPEHAVTGCVIDSREVKPGALFVAFPGEHVDGNTYVAKALQAGAACAVVTRKPNQDALDIARRGGCAIVHAANGDPEEFMLRLATWWRNQHPDWLVCGVTGSVGKTTTKNMTAAALGAKFHTHATKGNFNNLIGVPLTLFAAPDDAQALVVEMGMNHKGEIRRLAAAVRPTVAIITNIGTSHIGNLGSRENIARAKGEILSGMRPTAQAFHKIAPCLVLNATDDYADFIAKTFARPAGVEVVYVDGDKGCVQAHDITLNNQGYARFTLEFADGWKRQVSLHIPGRHAVTDALCALAISERCHVDREEAVLAITQLQGEQMRLQVKTAPGKAQVIDDTYNASPASEAEALDVLNHMSCSGRKIVVLGEMGELGSEARKLHGYVGAYAAAIHPAMLVTIGHDLAHCIAEAAETMGLSEDSIVSFDDVDSALKVIKPILKPEDLVLVKASRAERLDRFVEGVLQQCR